MTNRDPRQAMLVTNKRQAQYYDAPPDARKGRVYRVWAELRGAANRFRREAGILEFGLGLHRQWLGKLEGKRVLDLGAGAGNNLSLEMARGCGEYLAIDLSGEKLSALGRKLEKAGLENARVDVIDFLKGGWPHGKFDIIYSGSVLQAFRVADVLAETLAERLRPGGVVIAWEPLNTGLLSRMVRAAYRPFQPGADWEFPLTEKALRSFEKHFEIVGIQGFLGASKWGLLVCMIPGLRGLGTELGRRLCEVDIRRANRVGRGLRGCMQVAMCMRKRETGLR